MNLIRPAEWRYAAELPSAENELFHRRVLSAATLGLLAVTTLEMRRQGVLYDTPLPDDAKPILDSVAHPILGYAGAWIGVKIASIKSGGANLRAAALVGATALNFSGETAQSLTIASMDTYNYMASNNLPETAKDYGFALLGALFFLRQTLKHQANEK